MRCISGMAMDGVRYPVFDIRRYSINDGPGIRVTVFFKGCPLSCIWCHNPEGISSGQTRMYAASRCIMCRACVQVCPGQALKPVRGRGIECDAVRCGLCGSCAAVCPTGAVEMAARFCTMEEIYAAVLKERPFFETSGGGVTFSGGEPLHQGEALLSLLDFVAAAALNDGYKLHRAVDTTLFAPAELVREVSRRCELFLVDIKVMDRQRHRYFCGVPNDIVLDNMRMLASEGTTDYLVRIPFIDGVNSGEDNIRATAEFLASLDRPPLCVELLPYHDIGKNKHARMGTVYNRNGVPMATPSEDTVEAALDIFKKYGVPAKV